MPRLRLAYLAVRLECLGGRLGGASCTWSSPSARMCRLVLLVRGKGEVTWARISHVRELDLVHRSARNPPGLWWLVVGLGWGCFIVGVDGRIWSDRSRIWCGEGDFEEREKKMRERKKKKEKKVTGFLVFQTRFYTFSRFFETSFIFVYFKSYFLFLTNTTLN